jgi:hypothetical protein
MKASFENNSNYISFKILRGISLIDLKIIVSISKINSYYYLIQIKSNLNESNTLAF